MVDNDSLYITAIVAVVAVVGLIMAASSSNVVVADSMVENNAAIAGQASGWLAKEQIITGDDRHRPPKNSMESINTAADDAAGILSSDDAHDLITGDATNFESLTAEQIAGLPPEAMAGLTAEHVLEMSDESLAAVSIEQWRALLKKYNTENFGSFEPR